MPTNKEPTDKPAPPPAERNTPDAWAAALGTDRHLLAGAKVHNHWVQGDKLTQADFEAGMAAFSNLEVR